MYPKTDIILCLGSSCFARGNKSLLKLVEKFIVRNNLSDKVHFRGDHCFDECSEGPNLKIGTRMYHNVTDQNITRMLEEGLQSLLSKAS